MRLLKTATALVVMLLTACSGASATDADQTTINVFAAASLTNVFAELAAEFEETNSDLQVELNLAGSAALRSQILDGAPADVFASANQLTMTQVIEGGAIDESPAVFATNRLTIAVPVDNPGEVTGLADFERADLFIGLCNKEAPCGELAAVQLDAAGITPSVDTFEPDVRALLTKISAGELDAGLVYVTDVQAEDTVLGVEPADRTAAVTTYPIAVVNDGPAGASAERFVAFVLSADGQNILADHGFGAP